MNIKKLTLHKKLQYTPKTISYVEMLCLSLCDLYKTTEKKCKKDFH